MRDHVSGLRGTVAERMAQELDALDDRFRIDDESGPDLLEQVVVGKNVGRRAYEREQQLSKQHRSAACWSRGLGSRAWRLSCARR